MKGMKKNLTIKYIILLIIIDQMTKFIAQYTKCDINLFAGFGLKYVENKGLTFGWLSETGYGIYIGLIVHIVFIFIIFFYYYRYVFVRKDISWAAFFGFVLVISGAGGAILDRTIFGLGRDFFIIPYYAAINFADIFITIGAILVFIEFYSNYKSKKKNKIHSLDKGKIKGFDLGTKN
jgi:lipoprotein signal peptidase